MATNRSHIMNRSFESVYEEGADSTPTSHHLLGMVLDTTDPTSRERNLPGSSHTVPSSVMNTTQIDIRLMVLSNVLL